MSTIFLILSLMRMENMQKPLVFTKYNDCLGEKHLCDWLVYSTGHFLWNAVSTWKNEWKTVVIETWAFADSFLKSSKGNIPPQGERGGICWVIWVFKWKSITLINLNLPSWVWQLLRTQKTCRMRWVVILVWSFWYCIIKYISI